MLVLDNFEQISAHDAKALREIQRRDVRQSECLGDRRRDERRIPRGGQRHEHHAGRTFGRDRMRDFKRQTGLPDAAWPSERDQTYGGIREPLPQRLHLGITADRERP